MQAVQSHGGVQLGSDLGIKYNCCHSPSGLAVSSFLFHSFQAVPAAPLPAVRGKLLPQPFCVRLQLGTAIIQEDKLVHHS